ncbi:DUF6285 domain-containing protein [Nocardioides panacisoli]|uniref:DUF6285 domain-containing protein n=1 Tax=Nocardioides panacisoli TaxID=627624 RepID=A0ABP7HY70_9ACTN
MSTCHDRPDPVELLAAVREFLAAPPGDREALHRRVAANVVAIVERQLSSAAEDEATHAARLDDLGVTDERELAALAATLGEDDPRYPLLTAHLAAWARAKVAVVNPRYLEDARR